MQIEQKKPRKIRHVLLTSLFRGFHSQCDAVTEEEFHGGDGCRGHSGGESTLHKGIGTSCISLPTVTHIELE